MMVNSAIKSLVLVRHAQSQQNVAHQIANAKGLLEVETYIRQPDIEITPLGVWQSRETGKYLAKWPKFNRMYVSPYLRTVQTAELLQAGLGYTIPKVRVEERIRERELGVFDGLTMPGREQKYPGEWERLQREGPYYYRPLGGENYPDVALRVHSFLNSLRRVAVGQHVLVVSHAVVILVFKKILEQLTEKELIKGVSTSEAVRNCSVSRYISHPNKTRMALKEFNAVCFEEQEFSGVV
jgi:2,3-bisphosphoglycerate-dependent phosphoglycerate mutase